jgi:uncharacterized protein
LNVRINRSTVTSVGLLLALHGYIGLRLIPDLPLNLTGRIVAVVVLLLSCVLMPLGMMYRAIRNPTWADRAAWVGLTIMGFFSSLFVLTLLRDVFLLFALLVMSPPQASSAARVSALAVAAGTVLISLIGLFNARRRARVVDVRIPVRDLPAALHGFSIAQISDVHVGPTIKRGYVEAIVQAVNHLGADVIAITGDLVDGSVHQLAAHVAPLAQLKARHGAFFVTGNHEYYSGERDWIREVQRLGLRVLLNQHVVLRHQGASLVLAGVTDFSAHYFHPEHRSDPSAALAGAPPDASVKILLAHQPRSAPAAQAAGFDVQLSGHTHGGQFWPWMYFVRFQQPFTDGLHRLGGLWVYTSRGTGYWGPPTRFGAPSEITRIRLVPAES